MTTCSFTPSVLLPSVPRDDFELRFNSLFSGKALTFPCHRDGSVDIDALTDLSRNNYLAARALVGREYACPVVLPVLH